MSDALDQRVPGENHPCRDPSFPTPWPLGTSLSGWFCPTDQWPANEAWPGNDSDSNTNPTDDEQGADDDCCGTSELEDHEPENAGHSGL